MKETHPEVIDFTQIRNMNEAVETLQLMHQWLLYIGQQLKAVGQNLLKTFGQRLYSQLKNWIVSIMEAFRVDSLEDYVRAAGIYGQSLAASLFQLQQQFAGFKLAVIQAVAPLVQMFVPVVQTVLYLLTQLVQVIGQFLRLLVFGSSEAEDLATGMSAAAGAGTALKKSLAGFDQINRLNGKTGIGGVVSGFNQLKPMSASWKAMADKLDNLLEPLRKLDLTPAAESLERLRKAMQPITKALFEGLEWAWYNLLVPLAQWSVEELLPAFLDALSASMVALGDIVEELKPHFVWLWEECLKPLAQWKGEQIITYLQDIARELSGTAGALNVNKLPVDNFINSIKLLTQALGNMAQDTVGLTDTTNSATNAMNAMLNALFDLNLPVNNSASNLAVITLAVGELAGALDLVTESSNSTWYALKAIWETGWSNLKTKFMDPSYTGVRQSMNKTIDLLNSMLSSAATSVNFLGRSMNSLTYTVPNWVPGIGGRSFSFGIKSIQAPQIPYLAKGAVLPANKPFMAVVGDQKHGTNVEAPLTVIQEAVAAVMQDYASANLAGQQQVVGVLQELLAAVLGISIGDDMIAAAVQRYEGKMAVVRGGYV